MITSVIVRWFIVAVALLAAAYVIPDITVGSFYTALIVAALLGFLNLFIRPILFVLTLPLTVLTLGLFTFVLNGFILWFLASFVEGFVIANFLAAVLGALVVSAVSFIGNKIFLPEREHRHE